MNILASYNWIKEYLKTDLSPEEFAREMSLKSMSVESTEYLKVRYENVVIGLVKELKAHPDADKLRIAVTDIGGKDVEIVCGGSNLADDQRVVVALPGAKVRWHGEGELIELSATKIRGVESFGMICAPSEIGFEKYPCPERGIWDVSELTQAKAGTPFVEAFDMDDVLFDIEVTTNRSDAMNIVGLAREAGAALEQLFAWEAPTLNTLSALNTLNAPGLSVTVKEPDLCPRYMAVAIEGVKIAPSPLWLQTKLLTAGYKPINNIVDITNYILHEYGQPLHAFDYEKLAGGEIVVRKAKNGEKFLALDDIEYELDDSQLVIADQEKPVAIAGVMGGKESGTWDGTTTIVFEAATFDPISVRKTARKLNLYSQSQSMFEKGLSTESPAAALAHAVELALELAGGEVASDVLDERVEAYQPLTFPFRPEKARALIGADIEDAKMVEILERLGFKVKQSREAYEVEVPYWRDHDIEAEVDLAEEVARMYGYHNLPSQLPYQAPPTTQEDPVLAWEQNLKDLFMAAGYTELYGYSFVSAQDLENYDLDPEKALRIFNELTTEQTHMRTSLMPSLLKDIEANQGETPQARVFELQKVYIPRKGDLPDERTNLTIAQWGVDDVEVALLSLKGLLEYICAKTGVELEFVREKDDARWHFSRTATVKMNGEAVGMFGQVAEEYQRAFGIDKPVVAINLDMEDVLPQMKDTKRYEEIPEYPSVERDVAVIVGEFTEFGAIKNEVMKQSPLIESVSLVEVYRGVGIPEGKKSVTISLTLRAPDKTLESQQVDQVMAAVGKVLGEKFSAVIR